MLIRKKKYFCIYNFFHASHIIALMKHLTILFMLMSILATLDSQIVYAEDQSSAKALKIKEAVLKKQISSRPVRNVLVDARIMSKQGYVVASGSLPIEKQLDQAYKAQLEVNSDGIPRYVVAAQGAIGTNPGGAKMQATSLAKVDLASQVESQIAQIIESQVSNEELSSDEAASLTSVVSASRTLVQQNLGRVIPLFEVSRLLPNGNTEVRIIIGYDIEAAYVVYRKAIKQRLQTKDAELAQKLDKLI